MKSLFKIATALLAAANAAHAGLDPNDNQLSQSVVTAFTADAPRLMNEQDLPKDQGVYLTFNATGGAFQDGYYFNTTR